MITGIGDQLSRPLIERLRFVPLALGERETRKLNPSVAFEQLHLAADGEAQNLGKISPSGSKVALDAEKCGASEKSARNKCDIACRTQAVYCSIKQFAGSNSIIKYSRYATKFQSAKSSAQWIATLFCNL